MSDCICGNPEGTNAECERCRLIARIQDLESFIVRCVNAELCDAPYVSPEDQKRNYAMERGDYLRDRAKDER